MAKGDSLVLNVDVFARDRVTLDPKAADDGRYVAQGDQDVVPLRIRCLTNVRGARVRLGMRVRMEYAKYRQSLHVGSSKRLEQHPAVDFIDPRRHRDVRTRHYLGHGCVIARCSPENESAALIGQGPNARRDHRVSQCRGQVQHEPTLPTNDAADPGHYAGIVARAKQMQERRANAKANATGDHVVATNRRARHDYEIVDTLECGLVLTGSEVKSLREGKAQIAESFARIDDGELWLFGSHIPPWSYAVGFGSHDPDRKRKLLVHRHQIHQWWVKTQTQPLTIVPLKVYFKDGRAKVELALARGRKQHDRRQALAKRDAEREIAVSVRNFEKFG